MKTLVIGYGNTLRGDDGAGFRVAEAVESWQAPETKALPCHQLTPELAADIAEADRVFFVDATPPQNPHSPILIERIFQQEHPSLFPGHHSSPASLLALTQQLYDKSPIAYAMLLPSWEMGYSEDLSRIAQIGLRQGLQLLKKILTSPDKGPLIT
jgi:hydrogenase maturation protease